MKKVLFLSMMAGIVLASCSNNSDEPVSPVIPPSTSETTAKELVISDSQQADAEVFNGSEKDLFTTLTCGIRLNFQMEGVTQVVLESVDGYAIAGTANLIAKDGQTSIGEISDAKSIITFSAPNEYIVKGGAWDSSRDSCRSEYSDDSRDGTKGYANVGFRVVKEDKTR